jgi:hypothetical protein
MLHAYYAIFTRKLISIYFLNANLLSPYGNSLMLEQTYIGHAVLGRLSYSGPLQTTARRHIQHIIARLLLSATVYILWYERNNRVFSNQIQAAPTLVEAIFQQVRTQIASMEYGNNIPLNISDRWDIHNPSAGQS